jgi:hypothetical protein
MTLAPIQSQMDPVHALPIDLLKTILILSSYLQGHLPVELFPSNFHTKPVYGTPLTSKSAMSLAHLIILVVTVLVIRCQTLLEDVWTI